MIEQINLRECLCVKLNGCHVQIMSTMNGLRDSCLFCGTRRLLVKEKSVMWWPKNPAILCINERGQECCYLHDEKARLPQFLHWLQVMEFRGRIPPEYLELFK